MPTLARVMEGRDLNELPPWLLVDAFERFHTRWPKKVVAEVAFVLAVGIKREANKMGAGFKDKKIEYTDIARRYARECLSVLSELPADSLEDVATSYVSLVGVCIPEKFYLAYVKDSGRFPEFTALLS